MNNINYKFKPGDEVFAVNRYPIGARIFGGKIIKVIVIITESYTKIEYRISSNPLRSFSEEDIVTTLEEAEKLKETWLAKM